MRRTPELDHIPAGDRMLLKLLNEEVAQQKEFLIVSALGIRTSGGNILLKHTKSWTRSFTVSQHRIKVALKPHVSVLHRVQTRERGQIDALFLRGLQDLALLCPSGVPVRQREPSFLSKAIASRFIALSNSTQKSLELVLLERLRNPRGALLAHVVTHEAEAYHGAAVQGLRDVFGTGRTDVIRAQVHGLDLVVLRDGVGDVPGVLGRQALSFADDLGRIAPTARGGADARDASLAH